MYKSEKGITFMVLVITIIVLVIIGTTAAGAAISSYKNAKVKLYMKEMDLIKEKVLLYEEKNKVNSEEPLVNIGRPVQDDDKAVSVMEKLEAENKLINISSEGDKYKNYRYLANADVISVLNVKDLKESRDIIVDIVSKRVYSIAPVEFEKQLYYSADDIRD